nr:ribonuclease H-like domain-containing protein [Tanacetum cinerariifolium]
MGPNLANPQKDILEPLSKMIEVYACANAHEMWKRIKRLMHGYAFFDNVRHLQLMDEFDKSIAKEGESLESVYERAKEATKNHDLLALIAHSNASSSHPHAYSSYSLQAYYVTHLPSIVDYDEDYQGELQGDSQEDKLTAAMILLARAISQSYGGNANKNPGRNRNQMFNAGNRSDESNQIVQRVPQTDSTLHKADVQCYNCNEKGHYARDCQKPICDAKYFREQMLLAMKDKARSHLSNKENDFMLNNAYEDKTHIRLEVKARSTFMMGIPNEHKLKLNSIKDAKSLLEAIKKRFDGNDATKKTRRNLLKQQYENFTTSSSESLDQTFDMLQKLVSQLKLLKESISQEDVNQKFLRSLPSEWNMHVVVWRNKTDLDSMSMDDLYNNLKVNAANLTNIDNLSDAIICAFHANGHVAMRARRFLKNIGSKLNLSGNETAAFDKIKVECYKFHKRVYFAREYRAPRAQDNRNRESTRRNVPVETTNSSALVSCDGIRGYDYSDQAEERPNYAIMTYSTSISYSERVNIVRNKHVNTARPKAVVYTARLKAILDAVKGHEGNPPMDLQEKGMIDSGCSRHMTGNMSYLTDYDEIDRGYVAFRGNLKGGKNTRKGTIKTGELDFENVYFVKELKFSLFSVSQMCDKNSVLFNDTECVVWSPDFKLTNEKHVLLRVPRKNNMYSVDLKNIIPKRGLTYLFAKATSNESGLWHRRIGHLNFKTMNKLVKRNLEKEPGKDYILLPSWTAYPPFPQEPKSSQDAGFKPSNDVGKKVNEFPRQENECKDQKEKDSVNSTNKVNVVHLPVNAASNEVNVVGRKSSIKLPDDPNIYELEDISIFKDSNEDVFGSKWIFKNKLDERGIVIRNKARLVAQGHIQEEGIDYDEVFAPVARIEAIRMFLAYALFKDFVVYQMDVKSAFLYGKIEKEKRHFMDCIKPQEHSKKPCQHTYWTMGFKEERLIRPCLSEGTKVISYWFKSIYQVNPKVSHLHAVKRIFRYLKGQPKFSFWYLKDSPFDLMAYIDSDYARASLDRKSTTRSCQFFGCRLISCKCKKKTVVANSTTEAEYVAASIYTSCIKQFWTTTKAKTINGEAQIHAKSVTNEAINEEMNDRLVRAATTASSLEAEQDSDTMRDTVAQTRSERVSKFSNDSLLARVNTPRSEENILKLNELMDLCTNLQNMVLSLEAIKTTQEQEIDSLKRRVKKLDKKQRPRTHKLKRQYKVRLSVRVESSDDEGFTSEEVVVKQEVVADKELIVDAAQVSVAATTVTIDDITLAKALTALKTSKPKIRGIVIRDHEESNEPQTGLIYLNSKDEKRVMYLVEIVKFSDATLEKVLNEVKLRMFESQMLKKPPLLSGRTAIRPSGWSNSEGCPTSYMRMHLNRGRGKIEDIDADEGITLVDVETDKEVVAMDAETQGRLTQKDISAAEPTVFDDEDVTMTMAQTLIKLKAKKAKLLDE